MTSCLLPAYADVDDAELVLDALAEERVAASVRRFQQQQQQQQGQQQQQQGQQPLQKNL